MDRKLKREINKIVKKYQNSPMIVNKGNKARLFYKRTCTSLWIGFINGIKYHDVKIHGDLLKTFFGIK